MSGGPGAGSLRSGACSPASRKKASAAGLPGVSRVSTRAGSEGTGRRILWVGDALAPLRGQLPEAELARVVHAIAAVIGIDLLVWMTDIAGLSRGH